MGVSLEGISNVKHNPYSKKNLKYDYGEHCHFQSNIMKKCTATHTEDIVSMLHYMQYMSLGMAMPILNMRMLHFLT